MNTKELIEIEDDYFINTFTRQPIVLDYGEGVNVWDIDGNKYLCDYPYSVVLMPTTYKLGITEEYEQIINNLLWEECTQ